MTTVPFVPETAPFTAAQRAWLNGFLAGMFSGSSAAAKPAASVEPLKFAVYFASQSGTAEGLAKKVARGLKSAGHAVDVKSLEGVTPSQMAAEQNVIILASTYGDGEPPESGKAFRNALFASDVPAMTHVRYCVFALGDRNYEQFCRFGLELDERLANLGAKRVAACVEADVDPEKPFAAWSATLDRSFGEDSAPVAVPAQKHELIAFPSAAEGERYTREHPYHAPVMERRVLTSDGSSKQTLHLALRVADERISYAAGDACGVIPQNDPVLVQELLEHLPFSGEERVRLPKLSCSVREALMHYLQPTRLSRKMVEWFATRSGSAALSHLLHTDQAAHLDAYLYGRGLIDLLVEYPGVVTDPQDIAELLPRLAPRLYSISSSPAAHAGELHCTIGVVRYHAHGRHRGGIASTMIADRIAGDTALPIYIQPNKRFRLPVDGKQPIIMIGPGTGIAPFRSFLHERSALGHTGRNWLFFGERSATTDFLYRDELVQMRESGHLTRLDTAFSRDQERKVYVQHRMQEQGAELWRWLQEGAQVYVCGDASRMAKDVNEALHLIAQQHGAMSEDAAKEYISDLSEGHRYHRDVY